MSCPAEEDLAAFADGAGDDVVAAHVATCPPCAALLEHVRASIGTEPGSRAAPGDLEDPVPGATIGRYVILRRLGRGGMGVVVLAYDPVLDRTVALKVTRADRATPELAARLAREAQSLARLAHPNVVRVFDAGTWAGRVFLAMEHVEGETVRGWLATAPRTRAEIVRVFTEAARGLAATHAAGLVHRDVKPDNILVGTDKVARLADFGLVAGTSARDIDAAVAPSPTPSWQTDHATVLGTPAYMAPEQRAGRSADARADQWSFCASLREALGTSAPLPRRLRAVIDRGLADDPTARFADMPALIAALTPPRRTALWLAPLALAGGALVLWPRPAATDACAARGAPGPATWAAAPRDRVRTAFLATGHPRATERFATATALLDGHVSAWSDAAVTVCRKERTAGRATGRERACLGRRLDETAALVVALGTVDRTGVDQAPLAIALLTPLDVCLDTQALASQLELPDDDALRAAVAALHAEHDRLRARLALGEIAVARAPAAALVERARAVGVAATLAEAGLLHGEILLRLRDDAAAEAALGEAALAAAHAHDDRTAALARLLEARALGMDPTRHAVAERLAAVATAAVERAGGTAELVGERDNLLGSLRFSAGDHAGAEAAWRSALAARIDAYGPDHPRVAHIQINLSMALHRQGRLSEAATAAQAAIDLIERTLGPRHLEGAAALTRLATIALEQRRFDDAVRFQTDALQRYREGLGPDHPKVAAAHTSLGGLATLQGDHLGAVTHLERALAIRERAPGVPPTELVRPLTTLAVALIRLDRWPEAIGYLERAHQLEGDGGAEGAGMPHQLLALGQARARMTGPQLASALAAILAHGDAR